MATVKEESTVVPIAAQPSIVDSQPTGTGQMEYVPLEKLSTRLHVKKGRYSDDLFDCSPGECCQSCVCPCMIYGSNRSRLDGLAGNKDTHKNERQGDCFPYCITFTAAALFCLGGFMDYKNRRNVNARYGIQEENRSSAITSCFCLPCSQSQQSRQLEREEISRGWIGRHGLPINMAKPKNAI